MIIASRAEQSALGRRVARLAGARFSSLNIGHFPDGETNLRFRLGLKGERVVILESLFPANERIMEALFSAYTARDLGAKRVTLVAPYLAYMREDKRFHKGECVSAKVLGALLSAAFDSIVTIDPHLHRFKSLREVFSVPSKRLSSVPLIADFIRKKYPSSMLVGPDEESEQWVSNVASLAGLDHDVLKKTRYSSTRVRVSFKSSHDFNGRTAVIVDDIISTGHTVLETVKHLKRAKAGKIVCVAVHGLFTLDSYSKLKREGVEVHTTNTVPHETNRIDVSGLIAGAL